jgi:hypothetical protein
MPVSDEEQLDWHAVRCVFASRWPSAADGNTYEERITLWRAPTSGRAIERAEAEAAEYAAMIKDAPDTFLGFSQSYRLGDVPGDGAEIFSLMRDSDLAPTTYLNRFFDTGAEHQGHV